MTELQNCRRALMQDVGRLVEPLGYKPILSQQMFVRRFAEGKAALHLAFIRHPGDFDVVANVAIRLDKLEDILNGARTYLSDKKKRETYSFGAELGNISRVGQVRWTVRALNDTKEIAQEVVSYFRKVGLPFIASVTTIQDAYLVLTESEDLARLYLAPRSRRSESTVALAKLLGKSNVAQIAKANMDWLEDVSDAGLPQYKQFLDCIGVAV